MRILHILIFTLLFTPYTPCHAKYMPLSMSNMIGASDLIVVGTIEDVNESTFMLDIEKVVKGDWSNERIEVRRFSNWTCASRWAPYVDGQKALIFLRKIKDRNSFKGSFKELVSDEVKWAPMSGGNEGELPLVENTFYFRGWGNIPGGQKSKKDLKVYGHQFSGYEIEKDLLYEVIDDYLNSFKIVQNKAAWPRIIKITDKKSKEELDKLREKSYLHEVLIQQTEKMQMQIDRQKKIKKK